MRGLDQPEIRVPSPCDGGAGTLLFLSRSRRSRQRLGPVLPPGTPRHPRAAPTNPPRAEESEEEEGKQGRIPERVGGWGVLTRGPAGTEAPPRALALNPALIKLIKAREFAPGWSEPGLPRGEAALTPPRCGDGPGSDPGSSPPQEPPGL